MSEVIKYNPDQDSPLTNAGELEESFIPLPMEDVEKIQRDELEVKKNWLVVVGKPSEKFFERPPDEELESGFKRMIDRLEIETKIIDEIKDTVGKENLLRNPNQQSYPTKVEFGISADHSPETSRRRERVKTLGSFDTSTKKISMRESLSDKRSTWLQMIARGLPEVHKTLKHELNHFLFDQSLPKTEKAKRSAANFVSGMVDRASVELHGKALRISGDWIAITEADESLLFVSDIPPKITKKINEMSVRGLGWLAKKLGILNKNIADEVVAQKSTQVVEKREDISTIGLIERLADLYGYGKPEDIDQIIITSQLIDRMRVLGMGDNAIASRLAKAVYDDESASYPGLEKEISSLGAKAGLDNHDLDTRADLMRMRTSLEVEKAGLVAAEEYVKLLGKR